MITAFDSTQKLQDDSILTKYYEPDEVEQMEAILIFFDTYVLRACSGNSDIEVCYQQYFDRLLASNDFNIGIPFKDQAELYFKELDKEVIHSIWGYSPNRTQLEGGQMKFYNAIDYNRKGRYWKFMKDVAEAEPYFDKYVEPIEAAGTISQPTGFLHDSSGLNFSNERHRLILAVHFLTYNDQIATKPR